MGPASIASSLDDRPLRFSTTGRDPSSAARTGILETSRGNIETPAFMPVGTAGTVKAMPHEFLEELGVRLILGNTYHLYLRPGMEIIESFGGLHRFISWPGAILTDSGGYQVYSHSALNRITEDGVEFKSHLDGSTHFFSPEKSMEIQRVLASDIAMVFDECTPYPVPPEEAARSMRRSMRWAKRCREAPRRTDQAVFGIVQGSVFADLRRESLDRILELDFDGLAMGGFSVGEPSLLMYELLNELSGSLPPRLPHYLMGVGTPVDLVHAVLAGYDLFDCVLPTRNARNGTLFTWNGPVRIKNARYRNDSRPIDESCGCRVCRRFTRSYLRHLFVSGEILSAILNTCHNLYFFLDLMRRVRGEISAGTLADLAKGLVQNYSCPQDGAAD